MTVVLALILSLVPGCCIVGLTVGGSRAAAHNDEVARKLERGEPLTEDDKPVDEGGSALKGFAIGGALDVALLLIAAHSCCDLGRTQ